jgi:hypothetical protein
MTLRLVEIDVRFALGVWRGAARAAAASLLMVKG